MMFLLAWVVLLLKDKIDTESDINAAFFLGIMVEGALEFILLWKLLT